MPEVQHQSRTEFSKCLHAVDGTPHATHRSFHTDTKEFATRFMTDFKADIESRARTSTVRFSLVSFGTNVDDTIALDDDLQKTITDTNKIVSSGGWTNTEQAIAQCDQTLNSVGFSSLRYILLFTDGAPTARGAGATGQGSGCDGDGGPAGSPCRIAAVTAANDAKADGIEVITVAVNTGDLDVNFLYTLNSTGLGFTVDDFDDADEVTDKILGEIDISCPPSP